MTDPSRPSRFGGLAKLRQTPEEQTTPEPPIDAPAVSGAGKRQRSTAPREGEKVAVQQIRERGKRSDPAYTQISAYVRRDTYRGAQVRILESEEARDFSDVIELLLAGWIAGRFKV